MSATHTSISSTGASQPATELQVDGSSAIVQSASTRRAVPFQSPYRTPASLVPPSPGSFFSDMPPYFIISPRTGETAVCLATLQAFLTQSTVSRTLFARYLQRDPLLGPSHWQLKAPASEATKSNGYAGLPPWFKIDATGGYPILSDDWPTYLRQWNVQGLMNTAMKILDWVSGYLTFRWFHPESTTPERERLLRDSLRLGLRTFTRAIHQMNSVCGTFLYSCMQADKALSILYSNLLIKAYAVNEWMVFKYGVYGFQAYLDLPQDVWLRYLYFIVQTSLCFHEIQSMVNTRQSTYHQTSPMATADSQRLKEATSTSPASEPIPHASNLAGQSGRTGVPSVSRSADLREQGAGSLNTIPSLKRRREEGDHVPAASVQGQNPALSNIASGRHARGMTRRTQYP